ncbi:MAG: amidohydrolase family protein [Thermoanaerobaculaceae bacterium]|nr:amidohydrolase family protein [Thermoanaerobaculaceae bacterium]
MASRRLLLRGGTVVPMSERGLCFEGDVLVEAGRIAQVGRVVAEGEYETLDAHGALVLPGFVQVHVHVVQSLARHRAERLPLLRWLQAHIWPYEAALTAEEVAAAARLGIAELLCSGTTAALDMGTTRHQDAIFQTAQELGIRLTSGLCLMDSGEGVPQGLATTTEDALASAESSGQRWHGACGGRLRYAVSPRFALSCSERLLGESARLAHRHGWILQTHASENREETEAVRRATGRGNVEFLDSVGISGPSTVLAHCIHLDAQEVTLLAQRGTGVAHCPGANLKLASGIADVPLLLARGVRVGLGADGPPCNNRLSIFHEMALAGTLHNLRHGAGAVDPWTVLEMATWRGAEVAGLAQVGRLLPGWRADLVVLSLDAWALQPFTDPATVVVYGGGVESVRHVVVDGEPVVREGELVTAHASEIRRDARAAATALAARLGWE